MEATVANETRVCECGKHTVITSIRPMDYRPLCLRCFTVPTSAHDWLRAATKRVRRG